MADPSDAMAEPSGLGWTRDYIQSVGTAAGTAGLLLWGVIQTGAWGALRQHAAAFAAEAGWQATVLAPIAPWLRAGYDYGSGDHDPNDKTHRTFFQVLPTPRRHGRPSGGHASLANRYDVSSDLNVTRHVSLSGYVGYAASHAIVQSIYPTGGRRFGDIESVVHF